MEFPGFTTLQLVREVQELLSRLSVEPDKFHWTDYLHVDVQRHLMEISRKISKNANQALNSFRFMQKYFHRDNGHSSDLDQKRSGILLLNANHKENGTELHC